MKKNKYILAFILLFMINSTACQKSSMSLLVETEPQTELMVSVGKPIMGTDMNKSQENIVENRTQEDKEYDGRLSEDWYEYYNENKFWGNSGFQISDLEIDGVIYQRLANEEIELLSKNNGENTILKYNGNTITLPFASTFDLMNRPLRLEVGDFTHTGGKQLSFNVTAGIGTGLSIAKMHVMDLQTMTEIPVYDFGEEKYKSLKEMLQVEAISLEDSNVLLKITCSGVSQEGIFHSKYESMDQALADGEDYSKLIFGSHESYEWDNENNLVGSFVGSTELAKGIYTGIPFGEFHISYTFNGSEFIPEERYWLDIDPDENN